MNDEPKPKPRSETESDWDRKNHLAAGQVLIRVMILLAEAKAKEVARGSQ